MVWDWTIENILSLIVSLAALALSLTGWRTAERARRDALFKERWLIVKATQDYIRGFLRTNNIQVQTEIAFEAALDKAPYLFSHDVLSVRDQLYDDVYKIKLLEQQITADENTKAAHKRNNWIRDKHKDTRILIRKIFNDVWLQ